MTCWDVCDAGRDRLMMGTPLIEKSNIKTEITHSLSLTLIKLVHFCSFDFLFMHPNSFWYPHLLFVHAWRTEDVDLLTGFAHTPRSLSRAHLCWLCIHTEMPTVSLSYSLLDCQTVSYCLSDTAWRIFPCLIFRKLARRCSIIEKGARQRKGRMRDKVWQERGEMGSPAGGRKKRSMNMTPHVSVSAMAVTHMTTLSHSFILSLYQWGAESCMKERTIWSDLSFHIQFISFLNSFFLH